MRVSGPMAFSLTVDTRRFHDGLRRARDAQTRSLSRILFALGSMSNRMATITIEVPDELIPTDGMSAELQIQMALGDLPWLAGLSADRITIDREQSSPAE